MNKNGSIIPVVVLTVICLVVSGILGYVNSIADPIIQEAARVAAEEARAAVLPAADGFTQVTDLSGLPEDPALKDVNVEEVYTADNGAGTVAILTGAGYGGEVKIIVGIGADGKITGTQVLDHSETAGLGARIAKDDHPFRTQFPGMDAAAAEGANVISGSSVSSNCFKRMVKRAFQVSELVAGKEA